MPLLNILNLGLKFIPSRKVPDPKLLLYLVKKLERTLKITCFFHKNPKSSSDKEPFTKPSKWTPPPHILHPALFDYIDEIRTYTHEINRKPSTSEHKLSAQQRFLIKKLAQNPHIVIKSADKGGATVLMDTSDYIREANRQLADRKHYKPLEQPLFLETSKMITQILKNMHQDSLISKKQLDYLTPDPNEIKPRTLYFLPKIHKDRSKWIERRIPPGRPIVSDCASESYAVSELIDQTLLPLSIQHPAYVKNTQDFLQKITAKPIPADSLLITMDVESLYTNIDNQTGILAVQQALSKTNHPEKFQSYILELLKISLERNDFQFNNQTYLQTWGCAMGKRFAPEYANIFMAKFEQEINELADKKPLIYLRYLDDIFIVWTHSRNDFDQYLKLTNSHLPSIKMKAEIHNNSVDFLDLTIYKGSKFISSGYLDSKVYFKPTDSHQLLHTNSFHPKHTFPGIVKSQILRYHRNCSDHIEFDKACALLEKALIPRGYKKSLFKKIKSKLLKEINYRDPLGVTKCKQKRCLLCPQLNLGNQTKIGPNNIYIKEPLDCHSSNIIYVLSCTKCDLHYVGQTSTSIRQRTCSHRYTFKHKKEASQSRHLIAHFKLPGHEFNRDFKMTPLQSIPLDPNKKINSLNLQRLENKWIKKLNTLHPSGLNSNYNILPSPILPAILPFCRKSHELSRHIKREYGRLVEAAPNIFTQKVMVAYKSNPNLKNILVTSTFVDRRPPIEH